MNSTRNATMDPLKSEAHYLFIPLTVIGTMCCTFSLYQTFVTIRSYPKLVTLLFVKAMIIVDMLSLILSGMINWIINYSILPVFLAESSPSALSISCKIYNYFINAVVISSHGLVMILCFDRFLMLSRHRFLRSYYTVLSTKIFLVFFLVFIALCNCNYLWIFDFSPKFRTCGVTTNFLYLYYNFFLYIEIILQVFLPVLFNMTMLIIVLIQFYRGKLIFQIGSQTMTEMTNPQLAYFNRLLFPVVFILAFAEMMMDSFQNYSKIHTCIVQSNQDFADFLQFIMFLWCMKLMTKFLIIGFGMVILRHKAKCAPNEGLELAVENVGQYD